MRALACLCLMLLAAGCDRAPPVWERSAFVGEVSLRGPRNTWRGRLTFHRPIGADSGTLQLDSRTTGAADNATLLPSGKLTAFRDGVPRDITAAESEALETLAGFFAWPGRPVAPHRSGTADQMRFKSASGDEYVLDVLAEVVATSGHPK
jgi:hypothetical protein